jgi:5-methylcytosine-specific restriction protein A
VTIVASEHVPDGTLPMFGMSALRMSGHSSIECYGTKGRYQTVQSCLAAPVFPLNYQQPIERLEVFAPLLIHGSAASMVLRMACPTKRKGSDNWYYRRTIPADVRAILQKIAKERRPRGWYKTHISISLGTPDRVAAKAKCPEVSANVERQLKALREGPKSLTAKQIAALSGIAYRAFAEGLENNPGLTAKGWLRVAEANEAAKRGNPLVITKNETERREFSMEQRFGGLTDATLTREGIVTDDDSRRKLIEALARDLTEGAKKLARNADGDYSISKSAPLEGHPLAQFIRGDAETSISDALGGDSDGLIVQGSPGQGNWAAVPWISIFDPVITTSATRGYYVVYLFHAQEPTVYLSLNQGTTAVRQEFGAKARDVLADRAEFIRKRVTDFRERLPVIAIELGSPARLPADYVAGHAMGVTYRHDALPDEATLQRDLRTIVAAYRALTFRGGIEGDAEPQSDLSDEFNIPADTSITETRKYVFHRKIERNRTAAKNAKKFHGTICQACDLDFTERYGAIGRGFIEAHHLKPIGTLEEGVPVKYDVASEFAVLCANCHRMIHRTDDPSDLNSFRMRIIA